MTHSSVAVAQALVSRPKAKHWGYDLSKETGVRSGVLYPILSRMLNQGWLEDGWENQSAVQGSRPPRRYYEVTDEGLRKLGAMVKAAERDARFAGPTFLKAPVAM
ncbi:MAG: PadR family transcriptional regulator [Propionibacteriaceae bacterium]|nr:PadR family transcriptional regulator [Propionibacteriaceae bacterium]